MSQAEAFRSLVVARAGGVCEYCRLLEAATGVTFHLEHVVPRSLGGETSLDNLALSCPGCNLAKADRVDGLDHRRETQPLFNPRMYEPWLLGWHLHFILEHDSGIILSRSQIGEATTQTLKLNSAHRVFARKLQIRSGLIA